MWIADIYMIGISKDNTVGIELGDLRSKSAGANRSVLNCYDIKKWTKESFYRASPSGL